MGDGILLGLGFLVVTVPYFDFRWGRCVIKNMVRKITKK